MNRILIVEDEPDIQELLSAYLQQAGYQTSLAGDGVEALELFRSASFDLVLLDIMLPKIDGFGVCELIRQESQDVYKRQVWHWWPPPGAIGPSSSCRTP